MAGKAQAPVAVPPVTRETILGIVAGMAKGGAVPTLSHDEAGGQAIDPSRSVAPSPAVIPVPRPQGTAAEEPAVPPSAQRPVEPTPTTPPAEPTAPVYPGATPDIPANVSLEEAIRRISELEASQRREADSRKEQEAEARIASLPEDQQPAARAEHERMRRLDAELKLASMELKQTHPMFVEMMEIISETADIEVDPVSYRALAAQLEPKLRQIVDSQVQGHRQVLEQQVQQTWGIRPSPEQASPPPADHPLILQYKQARDKATRNPQTPSVLSEFVAAANRVRSELGLDPHSIV